MNTEDGSNCAPRIYYPGIEISRINKARFLFLAKKTKMRRRRKSETPNACELKRHPYSVFITFDINLVKF